MPELEPHTGHPKLVLAFDIGTTHSSVSYCTLEQHRTPEVLAVAEFPAQGVACADAKVPSILYYDRDGAVKAAGARAVTQDVIGDALSEGWTRVECWKLHLRPKHLASSIDDLHPLPSGKSAVDVLTDFIEYLFNCSKDYIQESHPTLRWSSVEDSIEYILTYPGGWGGQRHLYYEAIERAGLVPKVPGSQLRVHMLTEGEAALHFYISRLLNAETASQSSQGVVIIDAGGGIVGTSMFSMTNNLTSCEQIAPSECRLQGSMFVTRRARAVMEGKLEGWEHTSAENIARFTQEFDQTTKLVIETDQRPAYVKVASRRMNRPQNYISYGQLKLTGKEATGLFDESIDAIISAFQSQQEFARIPITTVIVVGGLSRNDWVWSRLQSYFMDRNINIWRPCNHSNKTLVANGAVLSHIDHENRLIVPRVARSVYDVIEQDLWRTKAENAALIESIRVLQESSSSRIAHLEGAKDNLNLTVQFLRADLCEALYAQGRIKDAVKSLIKLANTTSVGLLANKLIDRWITDFTHRCVSTLETKGDEALRDEKYDEAIAAYSTALSLSHSTPITVLNRWARIVLIRGSASEALGAASQFKLPKFGICRAICDTLEEDDRRVTEAVTFYRQIESELAGSTNPHDEQAQWKHDFLRRCRERLQRLSDDAMDSQNYSVATEHYSKILSLDTPNRVDFLIKRSTSRALTSSWDEALSDADEVIKLEPSCYRGYELKYAALHGAKRYANAVEAFDVLLSKLKEFPGVDIPKYVDARPTIGDIIQKTIDCMPRVLIDTTTGRLHDKEQQIEAFEAHPVYNELVSSMTKQLDCERIERVVKKFYQYVMLSHNWEHGEPLLQDVKDISIRDLKASTANIKLQKFCSVVRSLGFRWAWSDNSCVDKLSTVVLQESLVAMFRWYRGSSLTVVYLRGVRSKSQLPGDLSRSIWNTRAWTYPEYVAAETIQFYTEDWEPYLGLKLPNHKKSPAIISEMQQMTGVSAQEMAVLEPGLEKVREKLFLASRRKATLTEDIVYSLFGIFNVVLPVIYGEGHHAVGRFLEHILTASGNVTVLAWTGRAGSYNSCLPMDLTVFDPLVPPHVPRPIDKAEIDRMTTTLSSSFAEPLLARTLFNRLDSLPSPSLAFKRLRLSGILSPLQVAHVPELELDHLYVYHAKSSTFGDVDIKTADNLTGKEDDLYLVHPWIRPLLDQEFLHRAPSLDETRRALRFVARLRQPFGALLFEQVSSVGYRRVAADSLIMAQIREEIPLSQLIDGICRFEVQ